jgi:class 3 adenylate cyclase
LVTVLFADLTGSTGLGERFDPEDLALVMGTYFDAMREEIEAEGGTVEKFIGDAVMAVFGVPTAHEDDPARALNAALRMMDRLTAVNQGLTESQGITLEMRIGVNTGEVLANTDAQPGEPMVTGDVVNAAARLQTVAEPGQILVSERAARAVRRFEFAEIGNIELRGKSVPVNAFALMGCEEGASERGIPGLEAPLVGRDSELDLLMSIYERGASERRPIMVTLYGAAGVGKSRLTREFLDSVRSKLPSPIIVRGRCLPYGDGVAYWPLAEILTQVAGIKDTDSSAEALERIRAFGKAVLTSQLTDDLSMSVAALAHTMGLIDPQHSFTELDPREVRARTRSAWRSLFTALSDERPVVAVIEDIHWADTALLDILEELTDKVTGPVVIICPARPELTDRRPGWGGGRMNHSSIFLDPLTSEESDALVGHLLSIADFNPTVRQAMMGKAEGNPFFLEEIIRHLIDQGHIVREGSRWSAASDLDDVEIPDTVQGVLAARIDLLDPLEKRALQRAAVVGRIFWPTPVSRLLGSDADDLGSILDHLEDRELIRSRLGSSLVGEPEFTFKHVLTREVAYDSLPRRERGAAHAAVGAWIEEATRDRGSELVELTAYHWGEAFRAAEEDPRSAGDEIESLRIKAFESTVAASETSRSRAAVQQAHRLADEALSFAREPLERARGLTARGLAALSGYAGDVAWFSLKEAADLLLEHAPDQRRLIARTCARAVETPTRWPGSMKTLVPEGEVNHYLEIGLANLDPGDESEEMVRLLLGRSMSFFSRWKPGEIDADVIEMTRTAGRRAVEIADNIQRVDLVSAALDAIGSVENTLGDYRASSEVIERRLVLLDQIANPWEIGDALAMGSWNYGFVGDYRRARDLAQLGIDSSDDEARGLILHNTAWASYADFWLGNWNRVVTTLSATARSAMGGDISDPPYFSGHQFGVEAFIHHARRDVDMAQSLDLLTTMVDRAQAMAGPQGGLMFKAWEAWIRARDGDVSEALRRLEAMSSQLMVRPLVDTVVASVLLDARLFADSSDFIAQTRGYAEEGGIIALPPHLDRLEGAARLAEEAPGGLESLGRARATFADLGMKWEVARTDLWLAEGHIQTGDQAKAAAAIDSTRVVLDELTSLPEIERARSLLERL